MRTRNEYIIVIIVIIIIIIIIIIIPELNDTSCR